MATRFPGIVDSECLSALVDGELGAAEATSACEAWRGDETARVTWHSYQLIGDVLRSDDLASDAVHDCAFLLALRGRLASEPVVLAPEPGHGNAPAAPVAGHRHAGEAGAPLAGAGGARPMRAARTAWLVPSAMAAGFALVVGAFTVMRGSPPAPESEAVALAAAERTGPPRVDAANAFDRPTAVASANGPLLRDARLDRYLEAHKQFAGSSVLGVPSTFLRSATVDSSGR